MDSVQQIYVTNQTYESFDCDLTQGFFKLMVSINRYYFFMMAEIVVTVYSRRLKFLQVNYESFDCDLTQEFFLFVVSINVSFL